MALKLSIRVKSLCIDKQLDNATKIGCGITDFSVRTADFGTKCFWVNRTDGTTEKFSITGSIHVS